MSEKEVRHSLRDQRRDRLIQITQLQVQRELPLSRLDNGATEKKIRILDEGRENDQIVVQRTPDSSKDFHSRMQKFVPPKIVKPQACVPDASRAALRIDGPLYVFSLSLFLLTGT
jgi:hypothetical protein